MKTCANCSQKVGNEVAICPNCGASLALQPINGSWVGCLFILITFLDVVGLPFALLGFWGAGEFQVRAPRFVAIVYYLNQIGLLAGMILYYREAVRRGMTPQNRNALLVATIISAIVLGVGTLCTSGMIAPY